jgi:glycerol-3-phosphate O-acyltransferase / dihydroxyacetone phosphate acyltransferase
MNPILRLVYRFLQALAAFTTEIYFRKIVYINKPFLKSKAPLIVICNHPNTAIDPLLTVMYTSEPCYLLANYGLFKNPIGGAILRTLFCIPVKRVKDVAVGEERNNDDAFRASEAHLMGGLSLFVAAEGSCYTERHIREFKTGAARILFGAEARSNFALNVRILPIGLTYSDPLNFGSDVIVEVGEPFSATDWQARYVENPQQTVDNFMQFVENKFHSLTIHCEDVAEDHFLQKLESLVQSENRLDTEGAYLRSKKLLAAIQHWKKTDRGAFVVFKNEVETYFARLHDVGLKDVNTAHFPTSSFWTMLLGLPVFIIGLLPNALPAYISNGLVKWLKLDATYDSNVRMFGGLVLFPLFWWLETKLICALFFPNMPDLGFLYTILLAIVYLLSGLAAWCVYTEGSLFFNYQKFKRANLDNALTQLRQPIVDTINTFQAEMSEPKRVVVESITNH